MSNNSELTNLAIEVDKILKEELAEAGIDHDLAEVGIYDSISVGVQGDKRTHSYPAEITLQSGKKILWDVVFLERLSTRITNEIQGINRVTYTTATRKSSL